MFAKDKAKYPGFDDNYRTRCVASVLQSNRQNERRVDQVPVVDAVDKLTQVRFVVCVCGQNGTHVTYNGGEHHAYL